MASERSSISSVFSSTNPLTRFAAAAIGIWVVVEGALRRGGVQILADVVGSARGADMILVGIGFPLLVYGLAQWGIRRGISPSDWEYNISIQSVGLGFASVIVYFLLFGAISAVYTQVIGAAPSAAAGASLVENASETLWVAVVFLLVNGIVVPITEELAWRGVVQTALMESYGIYVGGAITAIAFVLKHLIVDAAAPFLRVASLVILAFILSGLRVRYGTVSSTVAHLAANGLASAAVLFAAL